VNSSADFGGAVVVRAHADDELQTITNGDTGGAIAVGGTVSRVKIASQTRAFISDSDESGSDADAATSGIYARGVEVGTVSREVIDDLVVGVGGGAIAVAGTVSVADIAGSNDAFIRDSDVFSRANLDVLANDTAILDPKVGNGAAGLVG